MSHYEVHQIEGSPELLLIKISSTMMVPCGTVKDPDSRLESMSDEYKIPKQALRDLVTNRQGKTVLCDGLVTVHYRQNEARLFAEVYFSNRTFNVGVEIAYFMFMH